MSLEKIITGGQTGVDRGALDAALALKFPCGGWCPADRVAEDGRIPEWYPLTPLHAAGCRERTLKNVLDSDATVIIATGRIRGGTRLTRDYCLRHSRPLLLIDAAVTDTHEAAHRIARFAREHAIRVLNVAGPRASEWPQSHAFAACAVRALLAMLRTPGSPRDS